MGPLVVSITIFDTGDRKCVDLWNHLSGAVARKPSRKKGGPVVIADSKKIYNRKSGKGTGPLERGVLAFLAADGDCSVVPGRVIELLSLVSPGVARHVLEYPWYGSCDLSLPRKVDKTDIETTANSLRVHMREKRIKLLQMKAEVLPAGEYNRLVGISRNKAATALDITCGHLWKLWEAGGGKDTYAAVDRQGGRTHYRNILMRIFPGAAMKVIEESSKKSDYILAGRDRKLRVVFKPDAESGFLPVALASMISKYIRELFMEMFCDFWISRIENLEPTAGYYTDGRRFFEEIRPEMKKLDIPENMVYRCR